MRAERHARGLPAHRTAAMIALATAASALGGRPTAGAEAGATLPEAVKLPAPVACTFHDREWAEEALNSDDVSESLKLELSPGVAYAWVSYADKIKVAFPVGTRPVPVGVTLVSHGVRLTGLARASSFPLHLTRPFLVNEIFAPTDAADLRWTDARAGVIGVEIAFPRDAPVLVKDVKGTLRFQRSCDEVGIARAQFHYLRDRWPAGDKRELFLAAQAPIAVSATRGGPPVATLLVVDNDHGQVQPLEHDQEWSRVACNVSEIDVIGWVRNEHLTRRLSLYSSDNRFSRELEPRRTGKEFLFSCNAEIPLVAEARGQRRTVGAVAAGVVMLATLITGEYIAVRFTKAPIRPVIGARFLVRQSDARRCEGFRSP